WLVGPEVVALLFGEEFVPARQVAMLAAGGVMAASTAQVGGQVLVARARTAALAAAWGVGLLVAVAVMIGVGGAPDVRVATGVAAGELLVFIPVVALLTSSCPRRPVAVHASRTAGGALRASPVRNGAGGPPGPAAPGLRRPSRPLRPAPDPHATGSATRSATAGESRPGRLASAEAARRPPPGRSPPPSTCARTGGRERTPATGVADESATTAAAERCDAPPPPEMTQLHDQREDGLGLRRQRWSSCAPFYNEAPKTVKYRRELFFAL